MADFPNTIMFDSDREAELLLKNKQIMLDQLLKLTINRKKLRTYTTVRMFQDGTKKSRYYSVDALMAKCNTDGRPVERDKESIYYSICDDVWLYNGSAISANDVLQNKELHADHYKRINTADLSYPIIITERDRIIDGHHRMCRAWDIDVKKINAYIISNAELGKFELSSMRPHENEVVNIVDKLYPCGMSAHKMICRAT